MGHLIEEQEKWIDEQLKIGNEKKAKHIIMFQHVAWFLTNPNEPLDLYFNVELPERKRMLAKLKAASKFLALIFRQSA